METSTFTIIDGYDKKTVYRVRRFTLDDIRAMQNSWNGTYKIIDKNGMLRDCRPNGALKTWKRDPTRFERSFKYGMYEYFRLNTEQMLAELVVVIDKE